MASAETRRLLNSLRDKYENNNCFECNTHNPQWVSVNNGVFICLECSGRHRSLGVHLSFVRSVTMDQWKEKEERLMEVGGNSRCRQFLETHAGDYKKGMSIEDKWKTKAAHLWRDKLAAEAAGRVWDEQTSPSAHMPLYTPGLQASAQSSINSSYQNSPNPSRYQGFGNSAFAGGSGAYQGGSRAPANEDDVWASLSSWGSYLTEVSSTAAQKATAALAETTKVVNETVIAPTAQKVQDGSLINDVSKTLWDTTEKVKSSGIFSQLAQTTSMATSQLSQTLTSVLGETGIASGSAGPGNGGWASSDNDNGWGSSHDGWDQAPATSYGSNSASARSGASTAPRAAPQVSADDWGSGNDGWEEVQVPANRNATQMSANRRSPRLQAANSPQPKTDSWSTSEFEAPGSNGLNAPKARAPATGQAGASKARPAVSQKKPQSNDSWNNENWSDDDGEWVGK